MKKAILIATVSATTKNRNNITTADPVQALQGQQDTDITAVVPMNTAQMADDKVILPSWITVLKVILPSWITVLKVILPSWITVLKVILPSWITVLRMHTSQYPVYWTKLTNT